MDFQNEAESGDLQFIFKHGLPSKTNFKKVL